METPGKVHTVWPAHAILRISRMQAARHTLPPDLLNSAQLILNVDGPPVNTTTSPTSIDAKSAPDKDKFTEPKHANKNVELQGQSVEYSMIGFAEQCVDKYCDLAHITVDKLKPASTPCLDENKITVDMHTTTGALAPVAAQIVLKMLWLARNYRYDIYYTVNYLARYVTKWSKACDAMLFHLTCYIHSTSQYVQQCAVGDSVSSISIALFVDANHVNSSEDSVSTGGALLALYGPNTFVPITAFCKRQRRVAHSSTESEMITLETGLRCEALPYMALWDAALEVFAPNDAIVAESPPHLPRRMSHFQQQCLPERSRLVVLEDNDAVIKIIIKGRSPALRHLRKVQRVYYDWIFDAFVCQELP